MTISERFWQLTPTGVIVALLVTSGLAGAADRVELSGASFDFGIVPPNTTLAHKVWIKSDGEQQVKINEIKTCCGCWASFTDDSTATDGDSTSILLYWNTRSYAGAQTRTTYLYLDPPSTLRKIELQGNVVTPGDSIASLDWTPKAVHWSNDNNKRPQPARVTFSNNTGSDLAVLLVEAGEELELKLPDSIVVGDKKEIEIAIRNDFLVEEFESSFTIELVGNQRSPVRVSIPIQYGDFSFRPDFTTR